MDKITVITVTFNAGATLERTILSVTGQTYPNIEFIIIDGQSKDNTVAVIKKYQNKLARWISEKDDGIYDAMNKGIEAATGDWLIFLGADDCFFSQTILSDIFAANNYGSVDMLYGNVQLSSSKKIFGNEKDYKKLLEQNINHQAIFYNKNLFIKKGKFNTRYKILADYHYNIEMFRDDSIIKKYVPVIIVLFNDKGLSNNTIDKNFFDDIIVQLVNEDKMASNTPAIQQFFFYDGFCNISEGKKIAGLKKIFSSIVNGKQKLFYFMVSVKFFLSYMGIGKKITFK